MNLVYSKECKFVVTELPLDIEEYNIYYDLVPEINTNSYGAMIYQEDVNAVNKKLESQKGDKIFQHILKLEDCIRNGIKLLCHSAVLKKAEKS